MKKSSLHCKSDVKMNEKNDNDSAQLTYNAVYFAQGIYFSSIKKESN